MKPTRKRRNNAMPFCPSCGYEYKLGITKCPDCGEKLVDRLPDKTRAAKAGEAYGEEYKNWTAMVSLPSVPVAQMIYETLREKEIPVVIKAGNEFFGMATGGSFGPLNPMGDDAVLFVPEEFVEDAVGETRVVVGDEWDKWKLIDVET
jgi:predicted RNA-binding Zn-ribbon protein involved in translation (DUF1610 family)